MAAFTSPVDIGNRAAQHCGASRMDATLGFADTTSRAAGEISACYNQLREAELQRRNWTFATKEAVLRAIDDGTMLLAAALWAPLTTYFVGSIVADQSGNLWTSQIPNNLNNDPLLSLYWEPYFGPMTVSLFVAGTGYYNGELVYTTPGDGTGRVYRSLQDGNSDTPSTATAWNATATYDKNQVVTFSSVAYMSLIDLNLNNSPGSAPALWAIGTTYAATTKVGGSDGVIYQSIGSGNVGHDPTTDAGVHWTNTGVLNPWTTVFVGGTGSTKWLQIGGAEFPSGVGLQTLNIGYPIGAGPSTQSVTRNAFRLPASYLRKANQNPKIGQNTWLGGPSGISSNDWNFESDYIVSSEAGPIRLRFIANVTDVRRMHTMFCEGLGARIGIEICQTVTQSSALLQTIASMYKKFMDEARAVNALEDGYDDPPDDTYVSVRL